MSVKTFCTTLRNLDHNVFDNTPLSRLLHIYSFLFFMNHSLTKNFMLLNSSTLLIILSSKNKLNNTLMLLLSFSIDFKFDKKVSSNGILNVKYRILFYSSLSQPYIYLTLLKKQKLFCKKNGQRKP